MSKLRSAVPVKCELAKQLPQQIVLRIAMSKMLAESFGVGNPARLTLGFCPILHGTQVIVYAVVFDQPVTLARMTSEHFAFRVNLPGNVNAKTGWDGIAEHIFAFKGIAVIEMRNVFDGRMLPTAMQVVRDRHGKGRSPNISARHFMIEMIVVRRMGNNQARSNLTNQVNDSLHRGFAEHYAEIALFNAMIGRADSFGRRRALGPANSSNFVRRIFSGSAVAWRHCGDVNFPAMFLFKSDQGASAKKLGIIRVSEDRKSNVFHDGSVHSEFGVTVADQLQYFGMIVDNDFHIYCGKRKDVPEASIN